MRGRFAVLAAALTTLVVVVAPSVATAAPRHNHGLTINVTPNPIVAGQGVLIYGQLRGTPVAGQTIRLYHRINPSPFFTLIGTTKTDSFGFYKFTREEGVVMTNRNWFVRGPSGTHSRTVHERVQAQVNIAANTTTSDTKTPITFTGQVTPGHRFQRVFLQEKLGSSDDWRTIAGGMLDGTSSYSISHRWAVPGVYDVRVALRSDARNIASASDPVTVAIQQAQVTGFTINTSNPIIPEGSMATISGVLDTSGTTAPEPTRSVSLWARTHGQPHFKQLQTTPTGNDGSYSFTVQPSVNTAYQVRTTFAPARHTAALFEGVQDTLQFAADNTTTTIGGMVTFTGSVTPDKAGHVIYLERLGSDRDWHIIEVGFVRSNSTFQFVWRFGKAGSDQFRARIFSDPNNVGNHSTPPVTITVTPAVSPLSALPRPS